MKKLLLFITIFIFALSLGISATNKISPAIDVIAYDHSMIKSSVLQDGEFLFDVDDFDKVLGVNVQSITVTSLPNRELGRLMLDNLYVVENQIISREDFSLLKFVQTVESELSPTFKFKPNGSGYELECSLKALESVNLPPVATNGDSVSAWTNTDISCYGAFAGYDPEGDGLKFEIVSYPEKGLLTFLNTSTGDYKYTPYDGATGTDVFSYRVRDEYGNYSESCTVKMKIEKMKTSLVFSDFIDERYLNAAIVMHQSDVMTGKENEDGTFNFRPNELITREEFITLVMKVMGATDVPIIDKTRFADDGEISPEFKGYLESAFSLGILSGETKSDGVHINPKENVTTADAAIIINRIIGAKIQTSMMTFADYEQVPDNAKTALTALTELGIFTKSNGKISPSSLLTRAQTAQILMSLLEYRGKLSK